MLVKFSPIFVAHTKIIYDSDFVAPLKKCNENEKTKPGCFSGQ